MYSPVIARRPFLRWLFIIGLLIAIPISIDVARWTRNTTLEQLHQQAVEDLKVNIAHMQSRIDYLYAMTRIINSDERVLAMLEQRDDRFQIALVNRFLARFNVTVGTFAYILDTDGVVIASGNWAAPDTFMGQNYGFRPYFKEALLGDSGQYVAIGVTSKTLGYYVSLPIRIANRTVAVAVTKTDPQDLMLAHNRFKRPFIITDTSGVVIISNPKELLFHSLTPLSQSIVERLHHHRQYADVELKPLSTLPIETMGGVRVITLDANPSLGMGSGRQQYVLAGTKVPSNGWTAHILWPVRNLNAKIIQSLLVTFLALVVTLLLALFAMERWRYMKQLHQQAIRDPLTGLYTRLYMLESAVLLLASHDRNTIPGVGAIMLDLDHFKRINDQYGHSAGDNVLVNVSAIILKECRDSDIPIRYGGEELLIFMPTGDEKQVLHLAERIRMQIKKMGIALAGQRVHLTISGGIATHLPGESLEKLIDRADRMMYQAKQKGRDQIFGVLSSCATD
jgi:two-component system, NtrC family, C4-dicarboxylate transport sensor histidine kinase DctB